MLWTLNAAGAVYSFDYYSRRKIARKVLHYKCNLYEILGYSVIINLHEKKYKEINKITFL